jgi:peroxiredoxin
MMVDDGVVTELVVERGPGLDVSSADSVLDKL